MNSRSQLWICLLILFLSTVSTQIHARPKGGDGDFTKRDSPHFTVYQDVDLDHYSGKDGIRAFERSVLDHLEDAYKNTYKILSLRAGGKIPVEIYDPAVFDKQFNRGFNYTAVGFYHNRRIRVRGDKKVDIHMIQTLHHEYVHAVVDAVAPGVFPGWLNEGLAEWFERYAVGRKRMHGGEANYLRLAIMQKRWVPLSSLTTFSNLSNDNAGLAYLESYAMIDYLVRKKGERGLRDFIREVIRTKNVDKSLKRKYKLSIAELEQAVIAENSP